MSEADAEVAAIGALVEALEPLDPDAQQRVLDYTFKRLGLSQEALEPVTPRAPSVDPTAVPTLDPAPVSGSPTQVVDIRSLRTEKAPKSAIEMAAVVGFYLSELAPQDERKETLGTAEIQKYFKQAGQALPQNPSYTLKNAAAAGYFDSVSRGEYRLNPVGYNLVAHSLPRTGGGKPAKKRAKASPKRSKAKGKSTTASRSGKSKARKKA